MKPSYSSSSPLQPELAWAEARVRVAAYLRAHRLADPQRVERLAMDFTDIARAHHRPGIAPLTAAMETLNAGMRIWLGREQEPDGCGPDARLMRGRVALALGDVPARWPEHFLRDTVTPAELTAVIRESRLTAGPPLRLSHMTPRILAPAARAASPKWQLALRWIMPRMLTGALMVLSLIGAAYAANI